MSHYIVKNCDNHLFLLPNSCFHSHPWNHVGHVTLWPPRLVNYWKLLGFLPMGQEINCLCNRDHSNYEDSVLTMKNASGDVKLERSTALSDTAELLCQPWHLCLWTLRCIACLRRCRKATAHRAASHSWLTKNALTSRPHPHNAPRDRSPLYTSQIRPALAYVQQINTGLRWTPGMWVK